MNLIKEYPLTFTKSYCDEVIDCFEKASKLNIPHIRNDMVRSDNQADFTELATLSNNEIDIAHFSPLVEEFFNTLGNSIDKYKEDIKLLDIPAMRWYNMLVQRTIADESEAYHKWHCENAGRKDADRAMVYTLYLNDDFEGGETEYLYQKYRCKPETGKLVIFPASYTHIHRGGLLMSGTKYIATGWTFWAE